MNISLQFIELPDQEIQNKTGFFRNPVTGTIWKLSVKEKKLIIDVPNYSFQISPLSSTKFRPVNILINLDIEFEKPEQNQPLLMHIYAKGIVRATFKALHLKVR